MIVLLVTWQLRWCMGKESTDLGDGCMMPDRGGLLQMEFFSIICVGCGEALLGLPWIYSITCP